VRAGVRVRALLQQRPGRRALRRHPQGVRRQQRLQAAVPPPRRRPLRGRRHHHLRGAGQAPRPRLRLRRPDLRPPAAGNHIQIITSHDPNPNQSIIIDLFGADIKFDGKYIAPCRSPSCKRS